MLIDNLENMLAGGQDSPMLRFGLGKAYLDQQQPEAACEHLRQCLAQDAEYSAAWKLLGKALSTQGRDEEAREAYRQGILIAREKGDLQALKEMEVFLRRLDKQRDARG